MANLPRLNWQRDPEGGFVAWPDGEALAAVRFVRIRHDPTSSIPWHWWMACDLARRADHAHTRQAAADAATADWPLLKAEAKRLAEKAGEEEALRTMVLRMCRKGDLALSAFAIEASDSDRLRHIIWLIVDAKGVDGPARPLVEAVSTELGRRRVGGTKS